jgi:hypothetical protein
MQVVHRDITPRNVMVDDEVTSATSCRMSAGSFASSIEGWLAR